MKTTPSMPSPRRTERGLAMVVVLFLLVMLALVAAAVLTNSNYSASDALSVQTKNQTFDAAEAGANVAMWNLDQNLALASGTSGTNTVNGYTYQWSIVSNHLKVGSDPAVPDPDPRQTGTINVPNGQALIAGTADSILGGRTVYVEKIVALSPPVPLPTGAITCGGHAIISHQQITDITGNNGANVDCGTITSSGGGQTVQGLSLATGTVNTIPGYDGKSYTNEPPPTFLTPAQLGVIQSSVQNLASQPGNFSTAGNVTGGTIGTPSGKCVAFIGGNVTLKGSANLTNYCETTVVMGDFTVGGTATYQALPASVAHIVYVFGTGGTVLQGTPTNAGAFYVANANVTINGGGSGSFTGSIITPFNVTMTGGGTANFFYNSSLTLPPFVPKTVDPVSQWEY